MSRRTEDIPIRPRFGLDDDNAATDEDSDSTKRSMIKPRKTSTSATSYSEIPFLAQFPDQVLNDVTPTAEKPPESESPEDESDDEDDISSCDASKTPIRPNSLQCDSSVPYELDGANSADEMRHFVAENLEEKLRTASPLNKKDQLGFASHNSTPSTAATGPVDHLTRRFLQTQLPQLDANVLSDIEIEAQYLAASVDNLTENLCNLLHSISSITADNVEVHKNAVHKLTDNMDANIKCMYTIMAKTEEITKSMKPTEQLGQRIREIKRLVDMLDNTM